MPCMSATSCTSKWRLAGANFIAKMGEPGTCGTHKDTPGHGNAAQLVLLQHHPRWSKAWHALTCNISPGAWQRNSWRDWLKAVETPNNCGALQLPMSCTSHLSLDLLEHLPDLLVLVHLPDALAATTPAGLEHDWIANAVAALNSLLWCPNAGLQQHIVVPSSAAQRGGHEEVGRHAPGCMHQYACSGRRASTHATAQH